MNTNTGIIPVRGDKACHALSYLGLLGHYFLHTSSHDVSMHTVSDTVEIDISIFIRAVNPILHSPHERKVLLYVSSSITSEDTLDDC
jgi:hypothetical protein